MTFSEVKISVKNRKEWKMFVEVLHFVQSYDD